MKIKLINISHSFDLNINKKIEAVSNVSFQIDQNEFIGIIGPTGSGKTTLIEHLNCLLIPEKGSIEFEYLVQTKNKKTNQIEEQLKTRVIKKSWRKIKKINEIRKLVGIVFQFAEYQLFEETIEKDIIFGPINIGISKEEAKKIAKEVIVKVGLDESFLDRNPFELSGGQKRRVAIAGIIAMKPSILVFDEPTAGLDPQGAKEMLDLFETLSKDGTTIIIVSHNLDDILEYTKRTIFIKDGKIIKNDETLNILSDEEFLRENEMSVPKLISLTNKINQKYDTKIPYVKTIDELVNKIYEIKRSK
ncbi:MAG: energy-coupling factor transporter ATPase [Mycoplasmataceae bacterium]|nr:energy-coupling factor transporter ATPase [Mycoplasmataceae bacterium]MBR3259143.1 energy-coupling factor transporter ATPase [Mycoplasmataceae bacterium]